LARDWGLRWGQEERVKGRLDQGPISTRRTWTIWINKLTPSAKKDMETDSPLKPTDLMASQRWSVKDSSQVQEAM
jgi:hypothetical protein